MIDTNWERTQVPEFVDTIGCGCVREMYRIPEELRMEMGGTWLVTYSTLCNYHRDLSFTQVAPASQDLATTK